MRFSIRIHIFRICASSAYSAYAWPTLVDTLPQPLTVLHGCKISWIFFYFPINNKFRHIFVYFNIIDKLREDFKYYFADFVRKGGGEYPPYP